MTKQRPSWRRRQYIVNKPFQLRFIGVMVAVAILIDGAVYLTNLVFFSAVARSLAERGLTPGDIIFRMLDTLHHQLDLACLATTALITLAMAVVGVFYSHRIAGPLFNLTRHLNRLADGAELAEVRFRKTDDFKEIQTAFNRFLATVQRPASTERSNSRASSA